MLRVVHAAHDAMAAAVARDVPVETLAAAPVLREPARMRSWPDAEVAGNADALVERIRHDLEEL
jgi:hypothetical protein